jgi:hypothetical protein
MKKVVEMFRKLFGTRRLVALANIAEGTHEGVITKLADGAITTRFLVGKAGSDIHHVVACGASDDPIGVIEDEASAAEDAMAVALFGASGRTLKVVASEPITAGVRVYTAANGKVQDLPEGAGTYYLLGRALQAAGADGDVIEIDPCFPIATVVSGG